MIVRDIINDPHQPFDFFNDFKDTIRWLRHMTQESPQVLEAIRILEDRNFWYSKKG